MHFCVFVLWMLADTQSWHDFDNPQKSLSDPKPRWIWMSSRWCLCWTSRKASTSWGHLTPAVITLCCQSPSLMPITFHRLVSDFLSWRFEPSQPQWSVSGLSLHRLVSWCFEPSQPWGIISGLTFHRLVSWCFEPSQPWGIISGLTFHRLVSWCFEPSQPLGIMSGQTFRRLVS